MATSESKSCWLYVDGQVTPYTEPLNKMQNKDFSIKQSALTTCLYSMIADDSYPDNLMIQAIKYVNPCDDLEIKKLLLLFWEVIEKHNKQKPTELKSEFLLVCNSIRKDLTSPNEYIRGRILRLVSKLPYYDLFESVRSTIFDNLSHKHSYVRKNALSCIMSIIKNFGSDSLPNDINDKLKEIIDKDTDLCTKRNAYMVLAEVDPQESYEITKNIINTNEPSELGDLFIISIIKNLRKLAKESETSSEKAKIIKLLLEINSHKSHSVQLELANSLVNITSNQNIIRQAISIYSNLIVELNDNNLLQIIIKKLISLKERYKSILEENVVSLAVIINQNLTQNTRKLIFDIVSDLVNEANVTSVVEIFIKQYNIIKNISNEVSGIVDYKFTLIQSVFSSIKKYPNIEASYSLFVLEKALLFDTHSSMNSAFIDDQISIITEIFSICKDNVFNLSRKVLDHFSEISNSKILISIFYVLSEYSRYISDKNDKQEILESSFNLIIQNLGDLNLELIESSDVGKNQKNEGNAKKTITKTVINEDGTYGTTTTVVYADSLNKEKHLLREAILSNNYFFASNLVVCLTKILFSLAKSLENQNKLETKDLINKYFFNAVNVICSILKMKSYKVYKDANNTNRINMCLEFILENDYQRFLDWIKESQEIANLSNNSTSQSNQTKDEKSSKLHLPGEFINFRHVVPYDPENLGFIEEEEANEDDLIEEANLDALLTMDQSSVEKKNFVVGLTGIEDSLQVEAKFEIFTFDIVIEFIIRNKTKQDLQNITIDIYAPTNLEIIEKAPVITLAAGAESKVKSCIKFSSSCNSFIFGEISYSNYRGTVSSINLSGVFINLLNTTASPCSEANFRKCWLQYNWEHKVLVISKAKSFKEVIQNLSSGLNLRLVSPKDLSSIDEDSGFLVANLYTCSKLGEDALINLSIEKCPDKRIVGISIIRSKMKEFATFLGEKIKTIIK